MQEAAGFADFALDLKNPDFVKYAEAYGAKGYRIREVRRMLTAALRLIVASLTPANALRQILCNLCDVPILHLEAQRRSTAQSRRRSALAPAPGGL